MQKELIGKSRTRIEFKSTIKIETVISHREIYGGWIVKHESGKIYWYENSYTQSDIFKDLQGGLEII